MSRGAPGSGSRHVCPSSGGLRGQRSARGTRLGSLQPRCGSGTAPRRAWVCGCELKKCWPRFLADRLVRSCTTLVLLSLGWSSKPSQRTSKCVCSHHGEVGFWAATPLPGDDCVQMSSADCSCRLDVYERDLYFFHIMGIIILNRMIMPILQMRTL